MKCFSFVVDTAVQAAYQASKEKEQQLLAKLDIIKQMSQAKDQQISMLEQKRTHKQTVVHDDSDELVIEIDYK